LFSLHDVAVLELAVTSHMQSLGIVHELHLHVLYLHPRYVNENRRRLSFSWTCRPRGCRICFWVVVAEEAALKGIVVKERSLPLFVLGIAAGKKVSLLFVFKIVSYESLIEDFGIPENRSGTYDERRISIGRTVWSISTFFCRQKSTFFLEIRFSTVSCRMTHNTNKNEARSG
jgi:hypothetical protein